MRRKLTNAAVPLIQVKNLRKSYEDGETILKGISIDIEEGDLVSIIGPSGCGKSTFLRCLNCLEYIDSGSITIAGVTVSRSREDEEQDRKFDRAFLDACHRMRQEVGMVFQSFNLFPHKTVLENIMLAPMVVKHMKEEDARKMGMDLLDKVGLANFADKYPVTMSGGQTQRAAIARALAMQPKVMLYDEPTSALDPELVGEVLQVMKDLDRDGMTQVVVTHQMNFARDASDYIVFMYGGEIVEKEDGDVLFTHPRDQRTQNFLRHLNGVLY
jgi:polar amino acid transport system ATP-binding protein